MRRWISLLSSVLSLLTAHLALGAQTTGGVNWLDPLAYQKPAFVSITEPDNPVATYYIDGTSGSGSTCSSGSPCKFFSDLCGKTGMTGGPVYVYIKGTIDTGGGNFFYNYTNCYGSPGSEILVRPWPGFTATIAGTGNNVMGGDSPSQTHDWIFDGGPSLGITIKTQNDNTKVGIRVNANNFTFYRVQGTCSNNAGGDIIVTTAAGVTNLKIINSEFYDCVDGTAGDQQGAVYLGSCVCNGTCGYSNFTFRNNIVRNFGGEGIELNPRVASSGAIISGSAFRHTGFQTCSGTWGCRPSILVDGPSCGGKSSGVVITNNLMWDTGSGCVWDKSGGNPAPLIYNNTCFDYGKGSGGNQPAGINNGNAGAPVATVTDNIIYAPNGTDPLSGPYSTASYNLCASGKSCGTTSATWSANTFQTTDQNTSNFLKITSNSEAKGAGVAISGLAIDYAGNARTQATWDIGAYVFGSSSSSLPPPSNLRLISQ